MDDPVFRDFVLDGVSGEVVFFSMPAIVRADIGRLSVFIYETQQGPLPGLFYLENAMKYLVMSVGICLGLTTGGGWAACGEPSDFKDSVVKIYVSASLPNAFYPWAELPAYNRVGSGAVISGNRILTSAHVVANSTFIAIKKSDSDKRWHARIEAIGHDCDLALLAVDDQSFFQGLPSLSIGPLPDLQDTVLVVGFPKGGDELSLTQGVVSRIDVVQYSHSGLNLKAVQIDAAINAGNSGGPVIQNNRLVGIAFQSLDKADNIGYMVPEPIIRHFLDDLHDGVYHGFPDVDIAWNESANPFLRKRYGIEGMDGGVVLCYVAPDIKNQNLLREGDVILSVDGIPIGSDGTVPFGKNARLQVKHLFSAKQVGESIDLEVLRGSEKFNVQVPVRDNDNLVKHKNFHEKPPYYIYGGVVFTVLGGDLMDRVGKIYQDDSLSNLFYYADGPGRFEEGARKDIVVLLYVLADKINAGYHDIELEVVSEVNGSIINEFSDLVTALESSENQWDIILTEDRSELVFERESVKNAESRILSNYGIASPYSGALSRTFSDDRPN